MSRTIDEKVVEMRFDNRQFESNVKTTLSTLDKLKTSLNMDGATKGFENIEKAAKNISLDGIVSGVEMLQKRFSTLGIIGMRTLENLTDSALGLAKKTFNFLTSSIIEGGKKRAMNIENAHFQLQGLLKDEEKVQAVMQDAMDSVDGTAYAYDSAAKAASQFAASGMVAGEEMQKALRAITGVAAMTNSEYEDISRVFTTVAGNGRLMGDQLLQLSSRGLNAAATLADYLTKVGNGAKVTEAEVRDMVSKGKISFQTFAAAMDDAFGEHAKKANETFTGAMSNVKAALARIGAEFISPLVVQNGAMVQFFNALRVKINEIKKNIGPLAEMFVNVVETMTTAATKYVEKIDLEGPFKVFYSAVDNLKNVGKGIESVLKPIGEAFSEIFDPITSEQIYNFTENLKKFTETLTLSDETSKNLKDTFKGLFAILDIAKQAFEALFNGISPLFGGFNFIGKDVLSFTGQLGRAIVKFDDFIKETKLFQRAGEIISQAINVAISAIKTLRDNIKEKFDTITLEFMMGLLERIQTRISQISKETSGLRSVVVEAFTVMGNALAKCRFRELLEAIWNATKNITGGIAQTLGTLIDNIITSLSNANFSGLIDLLNGISIGGIAMTIVKFVKNVKQPLEEVNGFMSNINGVLTGVKDCLKAYQEEIKAKILLKIAAAVGILAAAIIALSLIDSNKLNASLGAITVLFADLMASMAIFNGAGKNLMAATGVGKAIAGMIGIAVAIGILASTLTKIGKLDTDEVIRGLFGLLGITEILKIIAKTFTTDGSTFLQGASQIVVISVALKILASVCKDLSELKWEELIKGLAGVAGMAAIVAKLSKSFKTDGTTILQGATQMVIAAGALWILAQAIKELGGMDIDNLFIGLSGIVGGMVTLVVGLNKLKGPSGGAGALLVAAGSLFILAEALKIIGTLNLEQLTRALIGIGVSMATLIIGLNNLKATYKNAGALIIVANALLLMAGVLKIIGTMDSDALAKSLIGIVGAMTTLVVGLNSMNGTLKGSAALVIAASALLLLTPVLVTLGSMSWESIAKGLFTLAAAFTVLGIAGALLGPIVPSIVGLCASLALAGVAIMGIGVGLGMVGIGLAAVATGLATLAAAGTAGATAIVASLTVIVTGIAGLIPVIIEKLGDAFNAIADAIASNTVHIGRAVKEVILMILDVWKDCFPAVVDTILSLISEVLASLAEHTPAIVDSLFSFLVGLIDGLGANLPKLTDSVVNMVVSFFSGVIEALKGIDTALLIEGIAGVGLITAIIFGLSFMAPLIPSAMVGLLGLGALVAELILVVAAIGLLQQLPGLNWLVNEGGELLQSLGTAIGKFVGGIAGGFMSGVSNQFPQIANDLSNFMTNLEPFLDGARTIDSSTVEGVTSLAGAILILTAANVLDGIASFITGGRSLSDFAEQLGPFGKAMKAFSDEVSDIKVDAVSKAATAGKTLAEMAAALPNSGGLAGFFAGENDMKEFGEQLVPFGEAIRNFGDVVDGIKTESIAEAATAGKAIAEMAASLPNSGGVAGFFAGENDMKEFGEQLVPFGEAMKNFGDVVEGVKSDTIQNSITIGTALSELGKTLPNTGGVVAWFTGDNDFKTFGDQLVPFGEAMKEYSNVVDGINSDVVENSISAARALSELATNLPNTGGMVSWFTGDNGIENFGKQIVAFGNAFVNYYNTVKDIDPSKFIAVTNEIYAVTGLINSFSGTDAAGLNSFIDGLTTLGTIGLDGFVNAFNDGIPKLTLAVNNMVTSCLATLKSKIKEFSMIGQSMITNFISGVASRSQSAKNAFSQIGARCSTAIKNQYNDFYNAGRYLAEGFAAGINSYAAAVQETAASMARGAASAARAELQINSPSKVGYQIGAFFGMGFVNSLIDYKTKSYKAGALVGFSAENGLREVISKIGSTINDGIDNQPIIRPILDLTSVHEGASQLTALFSRRQAMQISSSMKQSSFERNHNGDENVPMSNNYSFVQNNYSPKALSRIDIYRQTRNQFSALKGLVKT